MAIELLDFYDTGCENLLGTDTRENIHKLGLWHKTVHCWLYDKSGNIYFQRRGDLNKLYTTASGHIQSGENVAMAFEREIYEEIGIHIDTSNLSLISKTVWQFSSPKKTDNVVANVCISEIPQNTKFNIDNNEVIGIVCINTKQCIDLMNYKRKTISGIEFTNTSYQEKTFNLDDFLVMPDEIPLIKYGAILQAILKKIS